MCQPIHQNKIKGIKSKGLRYGLEHREKEAQLLSLSIHGAADYGQGRRQTWKSSFILFGGLQPLLAYLRRLLSFVMIHTHSSLATILPCSYAPSYPLSPNTSPLMPSLSFASLCLHRMFPHPPSLVFLPFLPFVHEPLPMNVISHLYLSL